MFKGKEVKRAFRDFRNAIQDFFNANYNLYKSRAECLMTTIQSNPTLSILITPYLDMQLDNTRIFSQNNINLPTNPDQRIAYVLQTIKKFADGTLNHTYLFNFFRHTNFNDNIRQYNQQIAEPALRDLLNKIADFEEDEITGREEVEIPSSTLTIINYGHITSGRDMALGQHIQQNVHHQGITDELIIKFLQNGIPFEKVGEARPVLNELDTQLKEEKPDCSLLEKTFSKLFDIGGAVMTNIVANVITNKEVANNIKEFLTTLTGK